MTKSAGFAPVSTNGVVSGNAVALLFVMVTVALAVPPAATEPKSSDVGDTLIAPVGRLAQVLGIDRRRVQDEVCRVVVRVLRAAVRASGQALVGLLVRARHQGRENRSLLVQRAGAQAHLVDDDISGRRDRDAAIVGNAGRIRRVAWDASGIPARSGVREQIVLARRQDGAGGHGGASARRAGAVRALHLPTADVDGRVAVVVDLDELVVAARRPRGSELADHDTRRHAATAGRRGQTGQPDDRGVPAGARDVQRRALGPRRGRRERHRHRRRRTGGERRHRWRGRRVLRRPGAVDRERRVQRDRRQADVGDRHRSNRRPADGHAAEVQRGRRRRERRRAGDDDVGERAREGSDSRCRTAAWTRTGSRVRRR